jgi:DNA-binding NarL/FixJ family response regulator
MGKIRIVVVDDHPLFQQGVIDAFSLEDDIEIVGKSSNGGDGLELIRNQNPDVAVVDVNLPVLNGQQITRKVISDKLATRIVLLTAYHDTEQVIHAMRAGAAAYCAKDVLPEDLINIVRLVAKGKYVVETQEFDARGIEKWIGKQTGHVARSFSDPGEPFYPLSSREMDVLEHVTRGMSNKEIAISLGISHQTVKNHVTAILRKLGVDDRTQAAVYALRRGWIRLHGQESE